MVFITTLLALFLQAAPPAKASISGTVVNANTGEPVASVRVSLAKTDVSLGAFGQMFVAGRTDVETTIPAEVLAAMRNAFESEPRNADASPELKAGTAALKALPADISEVVVSPMGGVAVVLKSSPPRMTDERGRFAFSDVEPGTYRLSFSTNGYAGQQLAVPFRLAAGEAKSDVVMKLRPTGAVSGHIRNAAGDPVAGVPVQIVRFTYDEARTKNVQRVAATLTDDRGEYRMFYLTPGRYYLSAGHQVGETRPADGPSGLRGMSSVQGYFSRVGVRQTYGLTYYPGVVEEDRAGVLEVPTGADLRGIDLVVGPQAQESYRVRGRISDPTSAQPPPAVDISMRIVADDLMRTSGSTRSPSYKAADGTFEMQGVSPGVYTITATPADRTSFTAPPDFAAMAAARSRPRALATVRVVNADVEGVVLTLGTSGPLTGRFRIDSAHPGSPISFAPLRLHLIGAGTGGQVFDPTNEPEYHSASADGAFKIDNVLPADYQFVVQGVPAGYYVKEVRLGDADVWNERLVVSRAETRSLDILLSAKVGTVSGEAVDAAGQPLPGAQVVLIPNQNRGRAELFKHVTADSSGRFVLSSMAPGEYTLGAWEVLEAYAYFDPEFISRAERSGQSIRVEESSGQTVKVRLIP